MVNLGDMVGSNIQQGLQGLPVAGVMANKRLEGEEDQDSSGPSSFQVT